MRLLIVLLLGSGLFVHQMSALEGSDFPRAMAAFGDSMTEALLAGYSNEKGLPAAELSRMLSVAALDEEDRLDAFRKLYAHVDLSWATGLGETDLVKSHSERIRDYQSDLRSWNFSVSGAHSKDLLHQVHRALAAVDSEGMNLDYILILVGANDLMANQVADMTPVDLFKLHVETALDFLLSEFPEANVLLLAPPPIFDVFEKSENILAVKAGRYSLTCGQMRRTIYGKKAILDPSNASEYEASKVRLEEYRQALREIAEELKVFYPRASIKTPEIPASKQRIEKILSVDCFHPSEWGQAELAHSTWRLGFWGAY